MQSEVALFVSSRSNPQQLHEVKLYPDEHRVSCDCPGFHFHGYCSHIKFYKKLIRRAINDSANKP